jgi:hypothetical protein
MKTYAINIKWDTDGEQIDSLPTIVEVPSEVTDDEIADFLSDKYGFCVFKFDIAFDIEQKIDNPF